MKHILLMTTVFLFAMVAHGNTDPFETTGTPNMSDPEMTFSTPTDAEIARAANPKSDFVIPMEAAPVVPTSISPDPFHDCGDGTCPENTYSAGLNDGDRIFPGGGRDSRGNTIEN